LIVLLRLFALTGCARFLLSLPSKVVAKLPPTHHAQPERNFANHQRLTPLAFKLGWVNPMI
jgi:hypothetical protein